MGMSFHQGPDKRPVPFFMHPIQWTLIATGLLLAAEVVPGFGDQVSAAVPFTLQGPGLDPGRFRVTAFATGLNYPIGMAELSDGSILVTSTDGPSFFSS